MPKDILLRNQTGSTKFQNYLTNKIHMETQTDC